MVSNNLYVKLIEILYAIRVREDECQETHRYQTRFFIMSSIDHLIDHGDQKELDYLINLNVAQALVSCLDSCNKKLVAFALDCIYKILYIGMALQTGANPYREILEESGGKCCLATALESIFTPSNFYFRFQEDKLNEVQGL